MIQASLSLVCEVLTALAICIAIFKSKKAKLLLPILAMAIIGGLVEIGSILSHSSIMVLPRWTNWYSYSFLTLTECWCILWFASMFTDKTTWIIFVGCTFTALWIAAKASIEPFHVFDATTFSIANIVAMTCAGSIGLAVASNFTDGKKEQGIFWIIGGIMFYAFVSLIALPLTNILEEILRKKIWWLNSIAFWGKTGCIICGAYFLSKNPYVNIGQSFSRNFSTIALLPVAITVFFLYKYFFLPTSYIEFAAILFIVGCALLSYFTTTIIKIALNSMSVEKSKRLFAEELQQAQRTSTEYAIKDIANATIQLRDIVEEEEHDQRLKAKLIQYIDLLTITCFGLLKNSRQK